MATSTQWVAGARPRTLPAAVSPVLAGCGVAVYGDDFVWWKALLCLLVSLSLQIGVNYSNDYSDGVRGTDAVGVRVGPMRLVGSGAAAPEHVKRAAIAAFGVAAGAGLVLALATAWWLVLVGAAALTAAWFYTGGARPYGYRGLGEISVFVFFGLVAVIGTAYVQVERVADGVGWVASGVGLLAVAILVANNLRDLPTDAAAGKRTLAVRLGDPATRLLFTGTHVGAYVCAGVAAVLVDPWLLLAAAALPLSTRSVLRVARGAAGPTLIPVLKETGLTELVYAVAILAGYAIAA